MTYDNYYRDGDISDVVHSKFERLVESFRVHPQYEGKKCVLFTQPGTGLDEVTWGTVGYKVSENDCVPFYDCSLIGTYFSPMLNPRLRSNSRCWSFELNGKDVMEVQFMRLQELYDLVKYARGCRRKRSKTI